jgi:hypothetical protein
MHLGDLLLGGEAALGRPVDVTDGGDPCGAELARGRWGEGGVGVLGFAAV